MQLDTYSLQSWAFIHISPSPKWLQKYTRNSKLNIKNYTLKWAIDISTEMKCFNFAVQIVSRHICQPCPTVVSHKIARRLKKQHRHNYERPTRMRPIFCWEIHVTVQAFCRLLADYIYKYIVCDDLGSSTNSKNFASFFHV